VFDSESESARAAGEQADSRPAAEARLKQVRAGLPRPHCAGSESVLRLARAVRHPGLQAVTSSWNFATISKYASISKYFKVRQYRSFFNIEVQHFDIVVPHFDIEATSTKKLRYRSFFDIEAACFDIWCQHRSASISKCMNFDINI
jgi:hypothetical protein